MHGVVRRARSATANPATDGPRGVLDAIGHAEVEVQPFRPEADAEREREMEVEVLSQVGDEPLER